MVEITGTGLTINQFKSVAMDGELVQLDEKARAHCLQNYAFLKSYTQDKIVYGINTGFGPMAQYYIQPEDQLNLQYNLIRSHSAGVGQPLTYMACRAVMLARLNSLAQGYSAVHIDLLDLLCAFLNNGIHPYIPEHGGVGASGDLVQLAHLGLNLIGEGELWEDGKRFPAAEVLQRKGITPLQITGREGLAVINGTSCMTGIGLLNILRARQVLRISLEASSTLNDLAGCFNDHYSERLNAIKQHPGQRKVAAFMRNWLTDSQLINTRYETPLTPEGNGNKFKRKVQEYYSLRCVPQIIGPVSDTLDQAEKVLLDELNSNNDNPVMDESWNDVLHGGNFHGDYVSLEMDKVKLVITKLSMLSERQINYMIADYLNEKFPKFLNLGKLGFNFGIQGLQFTATSTTAENQTLSNPMYVHSISTNADNQDIVSMGTNSALLCARVIENTFQVLAIEWVALLQAAHSTGEHDLLSSASRKKIRDLAEVFPVFVEDKPRYQQLENLITSFKHTWEEVL